MVWAPTPVMDSAQHRVPGEAVPRAREVGDESIEADRVLREERLVVEPFDVQGVREAEHERHVGVRTERNPLRPELRENVAPKRRDIDEPDTGIRRFAHVVALDVAPGAAVVDLAVLHRHPAECDQQIGVLDDRRPARVKGEQPEQHAEDMRQNDLPGREAVGVALVRMPADAVQEPPELARRVMELSGARPPVGAREDGPVSVRGDHACELARDEPVRLAPGNRDERLGAALRAIRIRAVLEPPLAHHRLGNPARIVEGVHHAVGDGRGIGVLFETVQRGQLPVAHHRAVRAPVCRRQGQVLNRLGHGSMPKCPFQAVILPAIQVAFAPDQFDGVVRWLMLNRRGLTVLVHPETGHDLEDHRDRALWMGRVLDLNLDVLR